MPIRIPDALPAKHTLETEHIATIQTERADHQDIRPLNIAILNLMPTKIATETQILRLLGNSPLQVEIDLLQTKTYTSKNTPASHLLKFYNTFDDIRDRRYDGLIVTGAPVETMEFEEVAYWDELCEIFDWATTHVFSTFNICWGAQAALYHYYGIQKQPLPEKLFGVFPHRVLIPNYPLLRGFDDVFYVPHSRHTTVRIADVERNPNLSVLSTSDEAGLYIATSNDGRRIFVTGHSEYDRDTLASEYFRDLGKGLDISVPKNYFPHDDASEQPIQSWRGHANLLYVNWLNFVYQETPYDLSQMDFS